MAVVPLTILEPVTDQSVIGRTSVTFRGAVPRLPEELRGVPLYYRWYSSLFPAELEDPERPRFSLNEAAFTDPGTPYSRTTRQLGVGSHVISFAVTDRPLETETDRDLALHGGVTGGDGGETPCLLHVFLADLLAPLPNGSVSLSGDPEHPLEALAPLQWASQDYQDRHNRLRYRFRFVPLGMPGGRDDVELVPEPDELLFSYADEEEPKPESRVRYRTPFAPDLGLVAGTEYRLTLSVEDKEDQRIAHQQTIEPIRVVE